MKEKVIKVLFWVSLAFMFIFILAAATGVIETFNDLRIKYVKTEGEVISKTDNKYEDYDYVIRYYDSKKEIHITETSYLEKEYNKGDKIDVYYQKRHTDYARLEEKPTNEYEKEEFGLALVLLALSIITFIVLLENHNEINRLKNNEKNRKKPIKK